MAAEVIESYPDEGGSRTPLGLRNRPWHVLSGPVGPRLDELAEAGVWSTNTVETAETVVEPRRARARRSGTFFTIVDDGRGRARGRFVVPSLAAGGDAEEDAAGVRQPAGT
jgi:hypothetical protein